MSDVSAPPSMECAGSASAPSPSTHGRKEGGRAVASSRGKVTDAGVRIGGSFSPAPDPAWVKSRNDVLEAVVARQAALLESVAKPPITVTLPDGSTRPATAFVTSPLDIATAISKGLAQACCVASVSYAKGERLPSPLEAGMVAMANGPDEEEGEVSEDWELWDLNRPLEGSCELKLHKFGDAEGQITHSSAHILGEALESLFGARLTHRPPLCSSSCAHLTHGPPTDGGFFYDSFMGEAAVDKEKVGQLESRAKLIVDQKQPFERVVANPFKKALISSKLPDGSSTTVYRCGPFIDLCKGPHLPSTGCVKAFKLTKNSTAHWLGQAGNDELQRELFFFDEVSPGSSFFLPHGTRIYNKLMNMIKAEYFERDYDEVITPNIFNLKLWETSGHAAKYKENMFLLDVEGQEFGLKPMNCPAHCMLFKHRKRSYRELPLRMADFGVLHRNELSGEPPPPRPALAQGRVPDDGHIFCMVSQIKQEVANVLDMIATVYKYLGMTFSLKLSTKPKNALGDPETWVKAEQFMEEALNEFSAKTGQSWTLNPGDGAFYGPKIDVQVYDALKRPHQCATAQLDFVLPMRFDLNPGPPSRATCAQHAAPLHHTPLHQPPLHQTPLHQPPLAPLLQVHRAVLGSVERMMAILIEHYAGKWPFFLSPRQAMVMAVSPAFEEYARAVQKRVRKAGYFVDLDDSHRTLNKMVREAQLAQYNYILVVGKEEEANGTVNVHGVKRIDDLIAEFAELERNHTLDNQPADV
ncbi:threonine-tRNA ligase [Emiliania huxleyi CCMP1516]|uniref:threonine--tRNA ligase n=2 Tax=Emiliania huxleyi TaxID=2903 RepID=A0A0D3KVB2_EMIH1|nr:threonine-tRNA ligase [Emiliania huxleyi CCMP1516]EOD39697.1 threonine-tRNA ligase [Emiliania huxleyi CCMP1516]|eukprot:XP_005792126.1 threonine-tRNA ligase [Emiliania huxleyi CCMP1516]